MEETWALKARYRFESRLAPEKAASLLAEEQSTGHVPPTARDRRASWSVDISQVSDTDLVLTYGANLVSSVPSMLALLQGEGLELAAFDSLVLVDLEFGPAFMPTSGGPRFGIAGIRSMSCVPERPLVAAILKPSVGLTPEDAADLAVEYAEGGADIVKDDELASAHYDSLAERCRAVARALRRVSDRRGRPAFYALNITGPLDELYRRLDLCRSYDNVWPMLCEYAVGLDVLRVVAERAGRPVLCHRAGVGASIRSGRFGMSQAVQVKLSRLCGGDLVHCGSYKGKLFDAELDVARAVSAATNAGPSAGPALRPSLPLLGGGFGPKEAIVACEELNTRDVCFVFGASVAFSPEGGRRAVAEVVGALEAVTGGR